MWRKQQPPEPGEQHSPLRPLIDEADTVGEGGVALSKDEVAAALALHAESARRVALALVGPADAEDAVQEALVRGWQAWATLRNPAAVRPWLLSITVSVCRSWQRGRFGTHRRLSEPLEDANQRPLAYIVSHPGASFPTAALDLRNAINQLDESLRVVVVLRYYGGLDATEIGEALDIPSSTVRGRLSRALTLLRTSLGDSGDQPAHSRQEDHGV